MCFLFLRSKSLVATAACVSNLESQFLLSVAKRSWLCAIKSILVACSTLLARVVDRVRMVCECESQGRLHIPRAGGQGFF